jgi:hypothetical protein
MAAMHSEIGINPIFLSYSVLGGPWHDKYLQPFGGRSAVAHLRGVLNRGCRREGGPREDERPVTQKPRVTQRPQR